MDSDEDDFVFYGTPIEREEEISSRKKKAVAEASGHLRTLPPWKQEVTDEEGRRRFHGAFTGGYSAGYYNTVGSKEGWTPQSFTSSRKSRAEVTQQSIFNFLDDDERAELEDHSLGTSMQFDTFGFTAAELARKQAEKEQKQRPSAIPGPAPDDIVLPATNSVGVKLLLKMGWRHGHSIKDSRPNSSYDARREARKAFLALSSDDAAAQRGGSEHVEGDVENVMELPPEDDKKFSQSTPLVSYSSMNPAIQRRLDRFVAILAGILSNCLDVQMQFWTIDFPYMPTSAVGMLMSTLQSHASIFKVFVLNPKQDLHGLGYDPFKHAPEFRENNRSRLSGNKEPGRRKPLSMKDSLFGFRSGNVAPGFGIGALEDLDAEDEDVYASVAYNFEETSVQEIEEPSRSSMNNKKKLVGKEEGVLPGFKVASNSEYQLERFDPPVIPKDFSPHHKFLSPLEMNNKFSDSPPPEIPPPEDNNLKILIEGVATLVARCGKLFEDLSREKNQSNPLFSFLNGGIGHDYYSRKLWEEKQKRNDRTKQQSEVKMFPSVQKMTAENRGKILGEKPLEKSHADTNSSVTSADLASLQSNFVDTFTKPASFRELSEIAKPFRDDPVKQERFEQFLKDKYEGGLRSKESGGSSNMSEAARARERLEFEATAEEMKTGNWGKESKISNKQFIEMSATAGLQFTSGGIEKVGQAEELIMKKMYPKREEFQWRPSPVLCKRFDIMDPYMGKPPPAPRVRSKMDSLTFMSDSTKADKVEETFTANRDILPVSQLDAEDMSEEEIKVEVENVERPVDLYKAIFSDDSDDDEVENSNLNQLEDPQKKNEAANATLSRLMAGDFLESLGKELGLEVPPELSYSENKARTPSSQMPVNVNKEDTKIEPIHSTLQGSCSKIIEMDSYKSAKGELGKVGREDRKTKTPSGRHEHRGTSEDAMIELIHSAAHGSGSKIIGTGSFKPAKGELGKVRENRKIKIPSGRHESRGSGSSEDERSRKHSKRHRRSRSSDTCSDTNDDSDNYRDRYHSRSKGRKKESSREKSSSSSRKHRKHHKKEHSEAKREKRREKG